MELDSLITPILAILTMITNKVIFILRTVACNLGVNYTNFLQIQFSHVNTVLSTVVSIYTKDIGTIYFKVFFCINRTGLRQGSRNFVCVFLTILISINNPFTINQCIITVFSFNPSPSMNRFVHIAVVYSIE